MTALTIACLILATIEATIVVLQCALIRAPDIVETGVLYESRILRMIGHSIAWVILMFGEPSFKTVMAIFFISLADVLVALRMLFPNLPDTGEQR